MEESHEMIIELINARFGTLHEKIESDNKLILHEIKNIQAKQDITNGNVKHHSEDIIRIDRVIEKRIEIVDRELIWPKIRKNWKTTVFFVFLGFGVLNWLATIITPAFLYKLLVDIISKL